MSRKKKRIQTKSLFKQSSLGLLIFLFFTAIFEMGYSVKEQVKTTLPSTQAPLEIYANELNDDLKTLYLKAISEAKTSIHLIIYSLIDKTIIDALNKKCQDGVDVHIVCDANASIGISRKLPLPRIVKRIGQGLTHQKILIIDQNQILLGSANLTHDSLRVHGNLVVGIDNPSLAQLLAKKILSMDEEGHHNPLSHLETGIGTEDIELWQLPDDPQAIQRMITLIESAKKSIRVAMFTWTRNDLTECLIKAHRKGLKVEVLIDRNSSKGASAKIADMLKKAGIPTKTNTGKGLLHYKFAYIDESTLINGSANWTKAAFTANDDYFLVIKNLTTNHRSKMDRLWETIWRKGQNK